MFREGGRQPNLVVIIGALWLAVSACSSPTAPSVPNVQGVWRGSWVLDACTGTGQYSSLVPEVCTPGQGELNLRVTQSDRALRASIDVCVVEISDLTGTVATDGTITLSGQVVPTPLHAVTLSSFQATINGTVMTGTFACTLYPNGAPSADTISFKGRLKDVTLFSRDQNAPP